MVTGLNHITLAVSDVEKSLGFYSDILGFTGHVKWDTGAYLSANGIWLCLSLDTPSPSKDYSHIAWTVDAKDFASLEERIKATGAKQWKTNRSEGESYYFLDPDGNKLEIHVGSLQDRLESLKQQPYQGLEWI